jgi:flagellar biosynthesis protein FlhF
MQTKTYIASSVPAALDLARKELGDDAMLMGSKPASAEARPYGRLEVTFAYDPKAARGGPAMASTGSFALGSYAASLPRVSKADAAVLPNSAGAAFQRLAAAAGGAPSTAPIPEAVTPVRQTPVAQPPAPAPRYEADRQASDRQASDRLASDMDDLRRQISDLKRAVSAPAASVPVNRTVPRRAFEKRSPVAEQLMECGLAADLADDIAAAPRLREGAGEVTSILVRELVDRLPVAPFTEIRAGDSQAMALVGPPGRGKTTTLIKIAVRFGLAKRIPVKIYMAGSHGIGCEEQMVRYASVLGVPCQTFESPESLALALDGDRWKGLVLIDTPGISPSQSPEIGEFARFFKRRPEIEKHLVLRADARSADISHVIDRFSAMDISRLLFTGLDEVVSVASMVEGIMRSRIPASLVGTGQGIPDDLEMVSAGWLARALLREDTRTGHGVVYGGQLQIESASAAVAA